MTTKKQIFYKKASYTKQLWVAYKTVKQHAHLHFTVSMSKFFPENRPASGVHNNQLLNNFWICQTLRA